MDEKISVGEIIKVKLTSRKFLLTATASIVDIVLMATGGVDVKTGLTALMALIAAFNVGQGIADKQ